MADEEMGAAIAAMEAARKRFEEESQLLANQRAVLVIEEAEARATCADAMEAQREFSRRLSGLMAFADVQARGESLDISFVHPHFASHLLAASFSDSLVDAKNYVETYFRDPADDRTIVVTVQRKEGKRPAEMVSEMREVMQAMLDHDSSRCPWCGCWFNGRDEHDADCLTHKARELAFVPSNVPGTDRPAID